MTAFAETARIIKRAERVYLGSMNDNAINDYYREVSFDKDRARLLTFFRKKQGR